MNASIGLCQRGGFHPFETMKQCFQKAKPNKQNKVGGFKSAREL
jgi:hypothetical protein